MQINKDKLQKIWNNQHIINTHNDDINDIKNLKMIELLDTQKCVEYVENMDEYSKESLLFILVDYLEKHDLLNDLIDTKIKQRDELFNRMFEELVQ